MIEGEGNWESSVEERLLVERFRKLVAEVRGRAAAAPDGAVLHSIESCVMVHGRELLRDLVEVEAQAAVDEFEKRTKRARARNAANVVGTKDANRAK